MPHHHLDEVTDDAQAEFLAGSIAHTHLSGAPVPLSFASEGSSASDEASPDEDGGCPETTIENPSQPPEC